MADAQNPVLLLLHRGKTHRIPLEGTQSHLQSLIESSTSIPSDEQQLLYKGRKLVLTPDAPVSDLNLTQKAMLLRKPSASKPKQTKQVSTAAITPLRAAEKRLQGFEAKLAVLREAVERHTNGFLDKDMTAEALEKDKREAKVVEEVVMRIVEDVDCMTVPEEDADFWRAERRAVVKKAQAILVIVDGVHEKIRELKEDRWGEVESRRGKG